MHSFDRIYNIIRLPPNSINAWKAYVKKSKFKQYHSIAIIYTITRLRVIQLRNLLIKMRTWEFISWKHKTYRFLITIYLVRFQYNKNVIKNFNFT